MGKLRQQIANDLAVTLEGDFGLPVEMQPPEGDKFTVNGQVLYDSMMFNPATGQDVHLKNPVVTLRRESLPRIPLAGEKWLVRIPVKPDEDAEKVDFALDGGRPPEGSESLGIIRLHLVKVIQQ